MFKFSGRKSNRKETPLKLQSEFQTFKSDAQKLKENRESKGDFCFIEAEFANEMGRENVFQGYRVYFIPFAELKEHVESFLDGTRDR